MEMYQCKKRKFISNYIMITVFTSLIVFTTGCGKKTVEYEEEALVSSEYAKGKLARQLEIPASYIEDLSTEGTGLMSLTINDNNIEVPDVDCMYIAYYQKPILDEEYKENLLKCVVDEDTDIYLNGEETYIEDARYLEDYYRTLLDEAADAGDAEYIEYYDMCVESMELMVANASMEREKISDYSSDRFKGYVDGKISDIDFYRDIYDGPEFCQGFSIEKYTRSEEWSIYKPSELTNNVDYFVVDADELGMINECKMSSEDAVEYAVEYLARFEFKDVALVRVWELMWEYFDYAGNSLATECDGYSLQFTTYVDGQPIYFPETMRMEACIEKGVAYDNPKPDYIIKLDDNGVLGVGYTNPIEVSDKGQERVEIISFEEALEVLNIAANEYYTEHPSSYNEIIFNDVKLTYYMIADPEETGLLKVIPVYVFAQNNVDADGMVYDDEPQELFIINAVDKTVIDVIEELEKMHVSKWYY